MPSPLHGLTAAKTGRPLITLDVSEEDLAALAALDPLNRVHVVLQQTADLTPI
jgi:hypothetical protein